MEGLSCFLFAGYGVFLSVPTFSFSPFYSPVDLDGNRWWLGSLLLICSMSLCRAIYLGRCSHRSILSFISASLWWAIMLTYYLANMPPLPIWGAFGCGLWMIRSWLDLRAHVRQHRSIGGGIYIESRHARS